jgi:hypothetical protein
MATTEWDATIGIEPEHRLVNTCMGHSNRVENGAYR